MSLLKSIKILVSTGRGMAVFDLVKLSFCIFLFTPAEAVELKLYSLSMSVDLHVCISEIALRRVGGIFLTPE